MDGDGDMRMDTDSISDDLNVEPDPVANRPKCIVHWFRTKGLRVHDNPALLEAVKGAKTWRCVYIIDPWFAGNYQAGINKWR